jgi:P4 family phage/plasmid primase-like protien
MDDDLQNLIFVKGKRETLIDSRGEPLPEDESLRNIVKETSAIDNLYIDEEESHLDDLKGDRPELLDVEAKKLLEQGSKILGVITDKNTLAKEFCDMIPLYYDEAHNWWIFNNKERYWKMLNDEVDVLNMIYNSAVTNIINSKERTELLNALKQEARRRKPVELPNNYIQFRRVIFDLNTGDKFPATSKYFCVNPLPWKIGKTTETPRLDKLFSEWVHPNEVQKLYEICAYSMLSDYPLERFFLLYGSGSNGKSIYRKILRKFIGDNNCTSTSLTLLSNSRFETNKLYKKLVCEMGETNMTKLDNTEQLKKLVSGKDLIGAEWKNRGTKDFINYAKLVISTNNIPPTDDKTDGFYRKTLIIDFPNQFSKEIDIFSTIPDSEYENLAAKCIIILGDLLKNRQFSNEGNFQERREKYESHSNPFDKFWEEFVDDSDPNRDIQSWEFEKRLNDWMQDNKHRTLSSTKIAQLLKDKKVQQAIIRKDVIVDGIRESKPRRCWTGIAWKD